MFDVEIPFINVSADNTRGTYKPHTAGTKIVCSTTHVYSVERNIKCVIRN